MVVLTSVSEPHNFDTASAPALSKNFDAAPAAPVVPDPILLQYVVRQPKAQKSRIRTVYLFDFQ
jgi:hypothetical protein